MQTFGETKVLPLGAFFLDGGKLHVLQPMK